MWDSNPDRSTKLQTPFSVLNIQPNFPRAHLDQKPIHLSMKVAPKPPTPIPNTNSLKSIMFNL